MIETDERLKAGVGDKKRDKETRDEVKRETGKKEDAKQAN